MSFFKFKLPIRIDDDGEYQNKLKCVLDEYISIISKSRLFKADDIKKLKSYCKCLNKCIELYYSSRPSDAFTNISNLIMNLIKGNPSLIIHPNDLYINSKKTQEPFYKARILEPNDFAKNFDMLHIPFSKRSIVKKYRFSIDGCPCIYLAKSSFTCWMEMNKPSYNKFFVSAVYVTNDFKLLNLAKNWDEFERALKFKELDKSDMLIYPLIIATSFVIKNNTRDFKSEYIISQLVTEACYKLKLNGIAYNSKRLSNDVACFPLNLCLAIFPPLTDSFIDSCKNKFIVSHPVNYEEFISLPNVEKQSELNVLSTVENVVFNFANKANYYSYYDFYKFDIYLTKTIMKDFFTYLPENLKEDLEKIKDKPTEKKALNFAINYYNFLLNFKGIYFTLDNLYYSKANEPKNISNIKENHDLITKLTDSYNIFLILLGCIGLTKYTF